MRILLVHSFYRPGLPSGENSVVIDQAKLLSDSGYEVEVWGPTSPDQMSPKNQIKLGSQIATGRGLDPLSFIESFQPDMVHVHNTFPNVGTRWLARCEVPIAMSLHNYRTVCANGVLTRDSQQCTSCLTGSTINAVIHSCYKDSVIATAPIVFFQRHLRAAISRSIETLIFTSEISREILSPHLSFTNSIVLPNYVAEVQAKVECVPAHTTEPYYVVVSRLTPEKGVKQLLDIWPRERKLFVIGDGPQRTELERISAQSNVHFLGYVHSEIRDALLSQARALILPSVTLEADPVVVAQALSAGTPCIVNQFTATASLANESPAIRVYQDSNSLAKVIADLTSCDVRHSARILYEDRWSAKSWLCTYEASVLHRK
jgi:glycosyltransferase involved in cell wall biosynthesis